MAAMTNTALEQAVQIAGGQSRLASLIGKSQGHVHYWLRHAKAGVPPDVAIEIDRALDGAVSKQALRPDIFGPVTTPNDGGRAAEASPCSTPPGQGEAAFSEAAE